MPAQTKLAVLPRPEIEPDLREFIDQVLVPILVRDALQKLSAENLLASVPALDGKSARSSEAS
jgi:hypothetical protein